MGYNVEDANLNTQVDEIISVQHVWARYEHEPVLEDINMSVKRGDFVGLVGPNGGGKTTLIKVLLGLLAPSQGVVRVMGRSPKEGRRFVGYVPQAVEFDEKFPINVWDVARMGRLSRRHLLRPFAKEDDEIVSEALRNVDMLELRHRPMGELSGGQRQRVYVARALAASPQILFLDEPTASVDARMQSNIYELLKELNSRVTILIITHDVGAVSSYVKTVGCLNCRLHYHGDRQITADMLEMAYHCPIDLIAHGVPHRVFADHEHREGGQ